MDDSVGSTIQKIKLQEQDNEAKLKEKREMDSAISVLKRSIADTQLQIEKSVTDQKQLTTTIDKLNLQLELEKIHHRAISDQIFNMHNEYINLKKKCDQGISDVWNLRSSLCQNVGNISDECDIWALLVKPICPELIPVTVKVENAMIELNNEKRLQVAKEKREKLIEERDHLRSEPDKGEEFLRTVVRSNRHVKWSSSKTESSDENVPIKFSTSPAAKRGIRPVMKVQKKDSMPWYQPFSIVGSLGVFLIYFCFIREENDLDLEFNKTLYERIKGLERNQLLQTYKFNKENGLSVEDIEKRLKEIEFEEAKLA